MQKLGYSRVQIYGCTRHGLKVIPWLLTQHTPREQALLWRAWSGWYVLPIQFLRILSFALRANLLVIRDLFGFNSTIYGPF